MTSQTRKRLANIEELGQALEDLMLNLSANYSAMEAVILKSEPLRKLDPELPNRLKAEKARAAKQLLDADWVSPERAQRLKKIFGANQNS